VLLSGPSEEKEPGSGGVSGRRISDRDLARMKEPGSGGVTHSPAEGEIFFSSLLILACILSVQFTVGSGHSA
jgi:hypothetical protein